MAKPVAVVAFGGNALIQADQSGTLDEHGFVPGFHESIANGTALFPVGSRSLPRTFSLASLKSVLRDSDNLVRREAVLRRAGPGPDPPPRQERRHPHAG